MTNVKQDWAKFRGLGPLIQAPLPRPLFLDSASVAAVARWNRWILRRALAAVQK